jgi:hypothetical protein
VTKRRFDWFEEPNVRRGGWSGVSRVVLNPEAPPVAQVASFVKLQENHFYGGVRSLSRRRLTFEREFEALQQLGAVTEAVPHVTFFAKWRRGADTGAILATEALDDWLPLSQWILGKNGLTRPDDETYRRALEAIAKSSRTINDAGCIHMGYSAKHIFVRQNPDGTFASRVVDLEKSRRVPLRGHRTKKDCSHFFRHTPRLTDAHKLHYLKAYFDAESFSPAQLRIIRKMRGAPPV